LIGEQYRGKEKLLTPNLDAFRKGYHYAGDNLENAIGLRARRAAQVGDRIFVDGNAALALGFVYGGATVCAWYPITPSSSVADAFTKYCAKLRVDAETGERRYAIVQAEDELAAVGVVVGAGWNGARSFTATSGPGVSLMTEFIGPAYFGEIPVTNADAHAAVGPARLRLRFARRHQARAAVPRGSARMLRLRRAGARPRRSPADAGVRHDRPRHRNEPAAVRTLRLGRRAPLRPRQD